MDYLLQSPQVRPGQPFKSNVEMAKKVGGAKEEVSLQREEVNHALCDYAELGSFGEVGISQQKMKLGGLGPLMLPHVCD